ncbi:hypothetical protein F5146DRAFT_1188623 [Armillaria mellea]|nr:hypothetical protein F5146DRAFT_1188623 [Armillaria mellea]
MARLPEAIFKAIHHLTHMESQKHMELVEALVYWCLVNELIRFEGIDEGQFSMDYDVTFKPMVKLTQWVARLKDWPSVLLGALQSQESSRSHGSVSTVATRNKDAIATLIQCVTISPLILFKWNKDAAPIPMQSLLYACSFDDREKLVVLKNVEKGLWSLLLGVAGGAFEPEKGLVCFLQTFQPEFEGAAHTVQISPWFDVAARLKPPRGSKTASIQVAPDAVAHIESTVSLPSTSNNNEDASTVEDEHAVAGGLEEAEDIQIAVANNGMVGAVTVFCEDCPTRVRWPVKTKADADADESPSEEERVPKKCKKKTKKKSQDLTSEDDDVKESRAVSSAHAFKHHKPPPFRLSKLELKVYADNGANDEDYAWHQGFLQASRTKGPVMDAVRHPLRIKSVLEERPSQVAHLQYSEHLPILPLLRERSMLATDVPPHVKNWEWNPWTARELGDLDMPIQVHGQLMEHCISAEPLRLVNQTYCGNNLQPLNGPGGGFEREQGQDSECSDSAYARYNVTEPLVPAASHLDACKGTWSIGSDLLGAPFPAAVLSWGLASNTGAMTLPHTNFGGSAVKIDILTGCKVWFVISKHQEDKRGETWDIFVCDFQVDSKVNSEVYKCEILLLEPGMLWFQHPNTLHAVATQANSLVFGQHFFLALAIQSVVMEWVHTAFLSWAITNVEHKDMRILLLHMMAHWKKVITVGEPLEEHNGHVSDLHTWEGLLDVCALDNLLIYLPALSKCQDEYWDNLHFAFTQYWELVSWGNECLALTGMDGSDDVYELYVAIKLSALQFGLALLDYHTSVADSSLYEALDSGDQFNRIWFWSNSYDRNSERRGVSWRTICSGIFHLASAQLKVSYDELPPIEEETDSSASSPLTDLLESEPLQSPPPAPAVTLVSMASPSRKALAKRPKTIIVVNLASSQSEDAASAVEEDVWHPATKRSRSIEWSEHEHSDILVGSKTPCPLKQSKSTKSINNWNASEQEAQDEEQNADHEDEDVGDDSDDEEHQADDDADTNGSDGAFLDNLESTSQAMWQANDEEGDDSVEDMADSLPTPAQDGWQVQEERESLSPGTEFDLALATIEVNEATDREIEETPPDVVMTSEDAFAQGETDEGVLRDIECEPPAHIHSLDTPGEISHLAKESSEVLHLSQTADLMALISATSHSLMTSLPMPQALIDDLFQTSVSSGASEDVADAISEDEFHDVIEVSSEEENAQPELPEELMLWWEQMKTALRDYLKDKQPLGAIEVEESAQCDMLQHESPEELVLGREQRRKELLNNQKDGKPLGPIEVEEGTPCNLLQCVSNVLDTNLESCWCFNGVSTPLEKKSLKRLMKMGKSWLDDGMVAIALEVLCQGYPSWGTAEPLALASLNAASKAFKNIMKTHTELGKSNFVLPIHQDCNHWILFHLNIPSQRMVCYDSLSRREHAATKTYNELSLRFAHAVSDLEHLFEFIVSKDVPRQKDSINCGVYMVAFAWYLLCHGRPLCSKDKFWSSEGFSDRFR